MNAAISFQIARCMADFGRHLADSMGGKTLAWNDVIFCNPGMASPFRNLAVPLCPVSQSELPGFGRQLLDFYPDDVKWVVWDAFDSDMTAAGLYESWTNPTMYRSRREPLPAVNTPPGFTVTPVCTDADIAVFERVRGASYRDAPGPGDPGLPPDSRVLGNQFRQWLGWIDGEPIATGAAFSNGELNAVKHISTLEPFRGKRIGAAMTAAAVNSSPLPAILDSDPPARGLYERLGFTTIGAVRFWRRAA
jgi:GNAT superfamily N-acetyltransferase